MTNDTKSIQKTTKTDEMVQISSLSQSPIYTKEINMKNQRVVQTFKTHRVVEREVIDLREQAIKKTYVIQKRLFYFFWSDTHVRYNTEHYACEKAYLLSRL